MKNSIVLLICILGILSLIQCRPNTTSNSSDKSEMNTGIPQDTMSTAEIKQKQDELKNRPLASYLLKLDFEYTGYLNGTETAYIGDSGKTVVITKKLSRNNNQQNIKVIWQYGVATHIDYNKEEVRTSNVRPKDTELTLVNIDNPEIEGYNRGDNEDILGRSCETYVNDITGISVWRWRLIDLKYDARNSKNNLKYLKEITNIEEDTQIPVELLKIPENYVRK